jgi:hypothetical protein
MSLPERLASAVTNNNRVALLCSAAILAVGFGLGSITLANGLVQMQRADRVVTVRGVAQTDVTANRASWEVSYSENAFQLAEALAKVDQDSGQIRAFLKDRGFSGSATEPSSANISVADQVIEEKPTGRKIFSVSRSIAFSTDNVAGVQKVEAGKDVLAQQGLVVGNVSASYEYTQLDQIKPKMIADATKDARNAAEKFADDSGSSVGGIKSARQGYFSVSGRDAVGSSDDDSGGSSNTATSPEQRVRVVTTIDYYLN